MRGGERIIAYRQRWRWPDLDVAVARHPRAHAGGVREADRRHAPWPPPL